MNSSGNRKSFYNDSISKEFSNPCLIWSAASTIGVIFSVNVSNLILVIYRIYKWSTQLKVLRVITGVQTWRKLWFTFQEQNFQLLFIVIRIQNHFEWNSWSRKRLVKSVNLFTTIDGFSLKMEYYSKNLYSFFVSY